MLAVRTTLVRELKKTRVCTVSELLVCTGFNLQYGQII